MDASGLIPESMIVKAGELREHLDSPLCNMEVANGKRNNDPYVETYRFSVGFDYRRLCRGCRKSFPLAAGAGRRDADPRRGPVFEGYVHQRAARYNL
jgi:hypothetical protein